MRSAQAPSRMVMGGASAKGAGRQGAVAAHCAGATLHGGRRGHSWRIAPGFSPGGALRRRHLLGFAPPLADSSLGPLSPSWCRAGSTLVGGLPGWGGQRTSVCGVTDHTAHPAAQELSDSGAGPRGLGSRGGARPMCHPLRMRNAGPQWAGPMKGEKAAPHIPPPPRFPLRMRRPVPVAACPEGTILGDVALAPCFLGGGHLRQRGGDRVRSGEPLQ